MTAQRTSKERVADDPLCPFCRSENLTLISLTTEERGDGYQVECDDCGALGPHKPTESEAEKSWGDRPSPNSRP